MKKILYPALGIGTLLFGCNSEITFSVRSTRCVNPISSMSICADPFAASRKLAVHMYQLKKNFDPCQISLADIRQIHEQPDKPLPDLIRDFVVDPLDLATSKHMFELTANNSLTLAAWRVHPKTKSILMIAVGYQRTHNSVRLMDIDTVKDLSDKTLYISKYDICVSRPCSDTAEEVCP